MGIINEILAAAKYLEISELNDTDNKNEMKESIESLEKSQKKSNIQLNETGTERDPEVCSQKGISSQEETSYDNDELETMTERTNELERPTWNGKILRNPS